MKRPPRQSKSNNAMVIKDTYERPVETRDGVPNDILKLLDHKHR